MGAPRDTRKRIWSPVREGFEVTATHADGLGGWRGIKCRHHVYLAKSVHCLRIHAQPGGQVLAHIVKRRVGVNATANQRIKVARAHRSPLASQAGCTQTTDRRIRILTAMQAPHVIHSRFNRSNNEMGTREELPRAPIRVDDQFRMDDSRSQRQATGCFYRRCGSANTGRGPTEAASLDLLLGRRDRQMRRRVVG
jgi:hypothetical protein